MGNGRRRSRRLSLAITVALVVVLMTPAAAVELPSGLLLSVLDAGRWVLVRSNGAGELVPVPTVSQPRTPAISSDGERIAYIAADGSLQEHSVMDGRTRVRVESVPERGLTQPVYAQSELIAVWLKDGTSVDTDLVRVRSAGDLDVALSQRSAQFEPAVGAEGAIYYSSVLCTVACGHVIQEIWRYRPADGRARQLTRLDGVSRQPFAGPEGGIWFSSNAGGDYHIWRLPPDEGLAQPITQGHVVDSWPVVTADGTLYFLRDTPGQTALMRLSSGRDTPERVELTIEFDQLKDLRLARCATAC